MVISEKTDIEAVVTEIASKSFKEFCDGMGLMFDIEIKCTKQEMCLESIKALNDHFTELAAAYAIEAKGSMNGTFHLLLDQRGLFTLPGIIVMHPPRRIEENCKKGTIEEVTPILDAVKELGNLLVGAWDKIARQEFSDNTHLLQTATHAGTLTDLLENFLNIPDDEEFSYLSFEITVESHSPFVCGVIMPKSLFSTESE